MAIIETVPNQMTIKQLRDMLSRFPKERDNEVVYTIVDGKRHPLFEISDNN